MKIEVTAEQIMDPTKDRWYRAGNAAQWIVFG